MLVSFQSHGLSNLTSTIGRPTKVEINSALLNKNIEFSTRRIIWGAFVPISLLTYIGDVSEIMQKEINASAD